MGCKGNNVMERKVNNVNFYVIFRGMYLCYFYHL